MKSKYIHLYEQHIPVNPKNALSCYFMRFVGPLILLVTFTPTLSFEAATLPFIDDFSGAATELTLVAETNTNWSLSSGTLQLTGVNGDGARTASASTSFPDIDGSSNSSFTLQTDFTVTGTVNGFLFTGFMVLGSADSPNFDGYLVETRFETGEMRIKKVGGSGGGTLISSSFSPLTPGQTYTATVQGIYTTNGPSGSDSLDLIFTIEGGDLATPRQVVASDNSGSLLTGSHFGIRNRFSDTTNMILVFDELSIDQQADFTGGATLPFTDDFNGSTTQLALTEGSNTNWSLTSGTLQLTGADGDAARAVSASISFSELGESSTNDFTMQTEFTASGAVNSGGFLFTGFMVLGSADSPNFDGYLVETRFETGEMRIKKVGGSGGGTLVSSSFSPLTPGQTYTATVQGTYTTNGPSGSDSLDLIFTIEGGDLATPRQVVASDNSGSLMTGNHFGIRNRFSNTSNLLLAFEELSVNSGSLVPALLTQVIHFDDGTLEGTYSEIQGPGASVIVTDERSRAGSHSLRATITTPDRRSEINNKYQRPPLGEVTWYGWSIYVPETHPGDGRWDIVTQFHDYHHSQPTWSLDGKAPTSIMLRGDNLNDIQLSLKYQSAYQTIGRQLFNLGPYTKGAWHDIVMQVKWTHHQDGMLKVWVNDVQQVDYTGPTYMDYPSQKGPYFKAGNYKGAANWPGTSPRILYFDEIRIGNQSATYEMVDPSTYAGTEVDDEEDEPLQPSGAWDTLDIGNVDPAGSATFDSGTYTVKGSGADIWGTADGFHLVNQFWTGDVRITARVISIENTHPWAKAGVMLRENLNPNSRHAMTAVTFDSGVSFQRRTSTGGSSESTTASGLSAPYWVRIERVGDNVTSYRSADGNSWTQIGSVVNIPMSSSLHVGLAVSSHNVGTLCEAKFDSLSIVSP